MKTKLGILTSIAAAVTFSSLTSCQTSDSYGRVDSPGAPWGISADQFRQENRALEIQRWQYEETRKLNGLD